MARKFWLVPILIITLILLARPRQAGQPLDPGQSAPSVATPAAVTSPPPRSTVPPAATRAAPVATEAPPATATVPPMAQPTTAPASAPALTTAEVAPPEASHDLPVLAAQPTVEPPALEPETAPPTPAATTHTPPEPSQPARIIIPAIELDLAPMPVGLDEQRIPIVPRHDAGWFTDSAMPGQGSNVVFWGHVLRWVDTPEIAAPFARVHELQPGAEVVVVAADGTERHYRVTQQVQVQPEDVHYIYPTATERVTLVSCIGDNVIVDGMLTKKFRLVTIAEPAG